MLFSEILFVTVLFFFKKTPKSVRTTSFKFTRKRPRTTPFPSFYYLKVAVASSESSDTREGRETVFYSQFCFRVDKEEEKWKSLGNQSHSQ